MEKETVLEIEFQPVFDKWAWRIIKQNEDILRRGEFKDDDISVRSIYFSDFREDEEILFIKGISKNMNDKINLCTTEEKALIEEKVKAINEKYGITKRWRAGKSEAYYCMCQNFSVEKDKECCTVIDAIRYEFGNYFKTEKEAKEYAEYIKKKSLEWHEKRNENE